EGSDKYRTLALNMRFKRDVLKRFFHQMKARLHGVDKRLMLIPNLSQWSLFLNIAAPALGRVGHGDLWDTANRGIDPFVLEGELDNASFTAVPVGPDGDADAYVAACQFSMIRAMNRNRDFCVGLFIGRFLANDLYRYLSPAEMIGSAVASGAKGLNVYGYCGLDDGGVLHAMDGAVRDSIGVGNRWARRAMAALGRRGKARIALLFPAAMALMEPYEVPGNRDRRLDMLGYYRAFCDWGYMVDVLHPCQLAQSLGGYAMLVMPENSSYPMDPDSEAERALRRWVEAGGVLVHGPCDAMARAATGIVGQPHPDDCVGYQGVRMLITSTRCASYPGRRMAEFLSSGRSAASENALGGGRVISLGFDYGLCHAARRMPHVPADKGNQDYYPVALADRDPVRELAMSLCPPERARGPQIECALFERGEVAVNHSPYPCALPGGGWVFQYPADGNTLTPHSAAYRLYPAD
ncbi:MAG: hypothetical protein GX558_02295, partial [Clostridiales bacterium]|nr:hypothetical protein [Clostridiales bacterium]